MGRWETVPQVTRWPRCYNCNRYDGLDGVLAISYSTQDRLESAIWRAKNSEAYWWLNLPLASVLHEFLRVHPQCIEPCVGPHRRHRPAPIARGDPRWLGPPEVPSEPCVATSRRGSLGGRAAGEACALSGRLAQRCSRRWSLSGRTWCAITRRKEGAPCRRHIYQWWDSAVSGAGNRGRGGHAADRADHRQAGACSRVRTVRRRPHPGSLAAL